MENEQSCISPQESNPNYFPNIMRNERNLQNLISSSWFESTYLPINSDHSLANRRLHLPRAQAAAGGPYRQKTASSQGGAASQRTRGWEHIFLRRVTGRHKHFSFCYENAFDFSRIQNDLFATHPFEEHVPRKYKYSTNLDYKFRTDQLLLYPNFILSFFT